MGEGQAKRWPREQTGEGRDVQRKKQPWRKAGKGQGKRHLREEVAEGQGR